MLSALCTASTGCLGRPTGPGRAVSGEMATSSRSGRRQRACAARCSTAGCSPTFQQCLLPRSSRCNRLRGPAPAASLRQRCLRLRHAHRLAARVACGGPAGRDARRERGQQDVQRSLTLTQSAADMRRGAAAGAAAPRTLRCGFTIVSSPRRRRHFLLPLAALPCPSLPSRKQAHTHTHKHTHY